VPANPAGGDVAAAFLFSSFALHAIVVEEYLTNALVLQFDIRNRSGIGSPRRQDVQRILLQERSPYTEILYPFQHDPQWQWLRTYRNRWTHGDPMRIEEFGLQFSSTRDYWKEESTTLPSGAPGRALQLVIGGGDPPETKVGEMLERGAYCFNLLAKQVDIYINLLEL